MKNAAKNIPYHHNMEKYLDEYFAAAGIGDEKKLPTFRSVREKSEVVSEQGLSKSDV